ncbi:hypothetical protein CHARACLAT_032182 [Characodon lateralis]|uniref:Secreted protein n=1 Tax=Characodon lateralis TaxID=208331 RepID=A0ABU7EQG8_9TELE|nr:hypothetical protein [Characodon lateralis]
MSVVCSLLLHTCFQSLAGAFLRSCKTSIPHLMLHVEWFWITTLDSLLSPLDRNPGPNLPAAPASSVPLQPARSPPSLGMLLLSPQTAGPRIVPQTAGPRIVPQTARPRIVPRPPPSEILLPGDCKTENQISTT